ncbi:hypothetical protein NPIL_67341 [Nephila pilipes]|uniref:Uncharacterized protein n=1 Tax=Nephila pilipes TaxID=299642 RepID=A0A8X6TQN3_NEPPI|nr:hypothetical protein NPIL_67341 [Nephila pilipes]
MKWAIFLAVVGVYFLIIIGIIFCVFTLTHLFYWCFFKQGCDTRRNRVQPRDEEIEMDHLDRLFPEAQI